VTAGAQAAAAPAKSCTKLSLSAALLAAARQSHFQLFFNPRQVEGRCADDFIGSGRAEVDLQKLAQLAGLEAIQVKPGLIALTEAQPPRETQTARLGLSYAAPVSTTVEGVLVTARLGPAALTTKRFEATETSIMTGREMTERPASNLVDAVSILPGLSTYADMGLGQSATGDPEFITVRGIDSSNNVYALNGARAPETDPFSRALSLKMLPPFGVQTVQIVKTPTADMDGDSIGGVVDIQTPTGFDFDHALTRVTLRGDLHDLALQTGSGGLGGAVQLDLARQFLNNRLAVYVTGYFQKATSVGETGEVGDWYPTLASQSRLTNFRQVIGGLSADEYKWDVYTNAIQAYGGNASIDYRDGPQSLYLRLIASRYNDQGVDSQFSLRQQLANTGTNAAGQTLDAFGNPVGPGLPGLSADAAKQVSLNPGGGAYNASGLYDPNGVMAGAYFQLRDQVDDLYTLKVGGRSDLGDLTVSYSGAYGFSRQARPHYVEGSSYGAPLEGARLQINWLNGYTPSFALTPAQQTSLFNPDTTKLWKLQGDDSASADSRYSVRIDLDDRVGGDRLSAWHAGLDYSNAYRSQYDHNLTGDADGNFVIQTPQGYAPPYFAAAGPSLAVQPGQTISRSFLNFPGIFKVLSRGAYVADILPNIYTNSFAINPATGLPTVGDPGIYTINDYNSGTAYSTEQVLAVYISADLRLGDAEIYPGLRDEFTFLNASYWDYTKTAFDVVAQRYTNPTPSLNLVYRPGRGRWVYRAAVRQGFSRPAIGLVASPPELTATSQLSPGAAIIEGNPSLKPTTSINYDGAVEYYGRSGSLFELALYRKTLDHVIYGDQSTGSPPQANEVATTANGLVYSQYVNGGTGYLNGLELNLQQRLIYLVEPFDRFGVGGNVTFQHSEANSGLADHFGRLTWLPRAPELIYNLSFRYEDSQLKGELSYQYTGLQLENLTSNNLDNFLQPTRFLNLSLATTLRGVHWSFSAKNLTNGPVFWKTLGPSPRYLGTQDGGGNGSYVLTGRVFNVTATTTW
jgi:TonB-dependent receptor